MASRSACCCANPKGDQWHAPVQEEGTRGHISAARRLAGTWVLLLLLSPPPLLLRLPQAVYGVLKEAEHRSTFYIPYWNLPLARYVVGGTSQGGGVTWHGGGGDTCHGGGVGWQGPR